MSTQEVSVTLATNVMSVEGTVNGTEYTWIRDGDTWTATVARADDGKYVVVLTIVDVYGRTTVQSITLYYGLHLVRDRAAADVQRVAYLLKRISAGTATNAEKQEFLEPSLKGAYNFTDLNRVGAAVFYLKERLHDIAGELPDVAAKRDWTEADIPTLGDMATYLADVAAIRAEVEDAMPEDTPDIPADMNGLTYSEANDIEENLWIVNELIMNIMQSWRYAGELYAGEV